MKLSPTTLNEYIGQQRVKTNLQPIIGSLENKHVFDDPMDHTLLCGPPGLGKTSLAEIIAAELKCPIIKLMGPQLKDIDSLSVLKDIRPWTFVFIDEIHALPIKVEEALYEPIDDLKWQGQSINKFTLIGATTKEGLLSKPLRSRFTITETLVSYTVEEMTKIVAQSATKMNVAIDDKATEEIAKRARSTPRIANQLLKRVNYYRGNSAIIDSNIAQNALDSIGIDKYGLDLRDREILTTIAKVFNGGPVGLESLATTVGEDISTISNRETYWTSIGIVLRSSKGRVLSTTGRQYIRGLYE